MPQQPQLPPHGLKMDALPLAEYRFRWQQLSLDLQAVPDLDALVTETADPDRLPFWVTVWDSAAGLARWVTETDGWEGTPVLELGCGPGLAGLAAAARGARVTQTDLFPGAVQLARQNARRNHLHRAVRLAAADWRAWPLRPQWPLILGSDITYERAVHPALLHVLQTALAPGGTACLADPGRPMSLDFLALAESRGWTLEITEAPSLPNLPPVYLYHLRPSPQIGDQEDVGRE